MLRKNVCILSIVHTGLGTFSEAKAKPESVMYYNNTKYGEDYPDQIRGRTPLKGGGSWSVAVFYNILDLAGISARMLYKEQQQKQESPEESPEQNTRRGKRPPQAAQGGQQRKKPLQRQQTRSERAANRIKRTLEMPQARV